MLRDLARRSADPQIDLFVESCGVGDWHLGHPADQRMQDAARARGVAITGKARPFRLSHYDEFDYILAADLEILGFLQKRAPLPEHKSKVRLITEYSDLYHRQEVPDPYCEPLQAFERVLDILEDSCRGLLAHLQGPSG